MESIRRIAWYSIVRYVADVIKGELLNVGIVMNVPSEGKLLHFVLKETNSKFKSALLTDLDRKIYKSGAKYMEYMCESINDNDLSFAMNTESDEFIRNLKESELPMGFIMTEKRFAKTANTERLFNDLLETYIGKKFLNEESGSYSMNVKRKATSLITQRNLINSKVKSNIKIRPVKSIPLNYSIDFGYAEDNQINLIHSAPDKLSTSNEWFQRINMISTNFMNSNKFVLLFDSSSESNEDNTIVQMVDYLASKDHRILSFDIFTKAGEEQFEQELSQIESRAGSIEKVEELLIIGA